MTENLKKLLPAQVTSYDLLKLFAVITMVIDHTGAYFFPDELWWRAIGRLSAPVWLFLIGFARSRDLSPRLWVSAVVLVVATVICGDSVFPANILATIFLIRLFMDHVVAYMLSEKERMIAVCAVLFVAAIPTGALVDYGSIGLLIALYGYLARQRVEGTPVKSEKAFAVFACMSHFLFSYLTFDLDEAQAQFVMCGLIAVFIMLYYFRPVVFTKPMPTMFAGIAKFSGRRTLEIYVVHLLLFKFLAAWFAIDEYGFFKPFTLF
jgi:hypothetical protein